MRGCLTNPARPHGGTTDTGCRAPSPAPDGSTYWLRMTTWQAIPPQNLFSFTPAAVITGDGTYLVPEAAVRAIFPGPLVMPLVARQVSEGGRETIIGWARELGLLAGKTDFVGDVGLAGGLTGRIELTVEGTLVTLTGVPEVDGVLEPGSPAAFAELWRRVVSLPENLASGAGPGGTVYAGCLRDPGRPTAGSPGRYA